VDITVDETRHKVPVVAGAAAVSTRDTVRLAQHAQKAGADGVMVVAPYYCHPGDEEIFLHYKALSESIDIPIMLYNNPGTSGVDMRPQLVERLASLKHVSYIKESTGDMRRTAEIIQRCGEKIKVFSGADNLALDFFGLGGVGWVCATGNLIPRHCSQMFELAVSPQSWAEAREMFFKALPLLSMLEYGPLVQCLKAGLEMLGRPIGNPRAPLQPLPQSQRALLREILAPLAQVV
jgi:4-hydroxy-tetrahydrodipicolinate synthase